MKKDNNIYLDCDLNQLKVTLELVELGLVRSDVEEASYYIARARRDLDDIINKYVK